MRKLLGVVTVLALALFAALPSGAAYPGSFTCLEASDCPDFQHCYAPDCVKGKCRYSCWA